MEIIILALLIIVIVLIFILLLRKESKNIETTNIEQALNNSLERMKYENSLKMEGLENEIRLELEKNKHFLSNEITTFKEAFAGAISDYMNKFGQFTVDRLDMLDENIKNQMLNNFKETKNMVGDVSNQIVKIDESQKVLRELSKSIISLESILNDKKQRGIFGEMQLYSVLENVFGPTGKLYGKQVKLSNGTIADSVIYSGANKTKIVVDSKFPLENYNKSIDKNIPQKEREFAYKSFVADVKKHIDAIANKYILKNETANFACMFIPAEAIFYEIVAKSEELINYAFSKKVYIVSPTTLMAYLSTVKSLALDREKTEKVSQIQEEYEKLANEFRLYKERWESLTKDTDKLIKDVKDLNITADKITKRFDRISNVELFDEDEVDNL